LAEQDLLTPVSEQLERTGARGAGLAWRAGVPLLLYVVLLAVVLFSPTSHVQAGLVNDLVRVCHAVLPDSWATFARAEVLMNAVIIAPLSLLGSRVWPRLRWQDWTAYAFIGATFVELVQGILLPGRRASFSDIVANTIGALLGALLAALIYRRSR
jgi:hypothetical protein